MKIQSPRTPHFTSRQMCDMINTVYHLPFCNDVSWCSIWWQNVTIKEPEPGHFSVWFGGAVSSAVSDLLTFLLQNPIQHVHVKCWQRWNITASPFYQLMIILQMPITVLTSARSVLLEMQQAAVWALFKTNCHVIFCRHESRQKTLMQINFVCKILNFTFSIHDYLNKKEKYPPHQYIVPSPENK